MNLALVGVSHHRPRSSCASASRSTSTGHGALARGARRRAARRSCSRPATARSSTSPLTTPRTSATARPARCSASPATQPPSSHRSSTGLADESAALHLFRVAAGLDSLVPGEGEILGQVRDAYEAGATGPLLDRLFRQALHAGRRARVETAIGESPASVPAAAAALAQQVFERARRPRGGRRRGGTHERAHRTQPALARRDDRRRRQPHARARRGARTPARGAGARARGRWRPAASRGRRRRRLDERAGVRARRADARARVARPARPPAPLRRPRRPARRRSGARVDRRLLRLRHRRPRGGRRGVARRAGARRPLARSGSSPTRPIACATGRRRSTVVPAIASLRARAEEIRAAELARTRSAARLSDDERRAVEAMTAQIVNKLLHLPTVRHEGGRRECGGRGLC